MILCCGRELKPERIIRLLPDFKYRERLLELISCPNCGKIIGELTQYNVITGKYERKRLSKRVLARYAQRLDSGSWEEVKILHGTKGGAGFVYGINRIDKEGNIYQYAVDFNGVKVLVKKTDKSNIINKSE